MSVSRSPLHFLLPYLKPWKWHLFWGLLLISLAGIGASLQIFAGTWLIDWILKATITEKEKWWRVLALASGYLIATIFVRMLLWHFGYRILVRIREAVVLGLRSSFFTHVNHLCLRFHLRRSSGELFSYLFGSPLARVTEFYQQVSLNTVSSVLTLVSATIMVFFWNVPVSLVLVMLVIGSVLLMNRSRSRIKNLHKDFQNAEGNVSGEVSELLRGSTAIKLYSMEERVGERFTRRAGELGEQSRIRDIKSHFESMKQEAFGYFAYALLMIAAFWAYLKGSLTLGQVTGYLVAYNSLTGPLQSLFQAFLLWGGAQASLERIGSVLAEDSSTPDPGGNAKPVPPNGAITFVNVDFSYNSEKVTLKDLNFRIHQGEKVAFVGPSGGGKSTILQLMLRLYDPDSGGIFLNDVNLRDLRPGELRTRFGVVPQDPFLFRTTIRENIRSAKPDASEEDIKNACKASNAWEFIKTLPKGLDTPVGEGGASLSGGQKQRIAIARAILLKPPIFLFDEATSALDSISEAALQVFLEKGLSDKTLVIVAHRLSTVRNCDRILVVDQGRIVQEGSFDHLNSAPGLFQNLIAAQSLRR